MQRFFTRLAPLAAIALLVTLLAACGGNSGEVPPAAPTAAAQTGDGPSDSGTTVHVATKDFAFALDTTQVAAGNVTFVIANDGPSPHDFQIKGNGVNKKTAMLDKGKGASFTIALKPGAYIYTCTVPGHDSLGMKGTLTVT